MSTIATSLPRARAASTASYATAAGSAPCAAPTKSACARSAQISSCSSAAARQVSAAPSRTERPCSRSFCGELADRRRLAGAVDADDEDDARALGQVQRSRLAQHLGDLLRERPIEVGQVVASLQPAHELGGGADADVALDQRLLEPLPVLVVPGIEGRGGELARERPTALAERVAQPSEEAVLLLGGLLRPVRVAQQLCPASRHRRGTLASGTWSRGSESPSLRASCPRSRRRPRGASRRSPCAGRSSPGSRRGTRARCGRGATGRSGRSSSRRTRTAYRLTPHFEASPAFLLIWLEHIDEDEVRERLIDAWLIQAPKRLSESTTAAQHGLRRRRLRTHER